MPQINEKWRIENYYTLVSICRIYTTSRDIILIIVHFQFSILNMPQYLRQNSAPSVIPCRVRAPGAWNLPAVATASGGCALDRKFPDRSHGMTWKGERLRTRCLPCAPTAVTVAPKHTCTLKSLPPKLHNALKSPIKRTILALGRIGAPSPTQRAAEIGINTLHIQTKSATCNYDMGV